MVKFAVQREKDERYHCLSWVTACQYVCLHGLESLVVFLTQVQLPLEVGMKAKCKWRDGVYRLARVVDRREAQDSKDPAKWKYYVHYYGCESA